MLNSGELLHVITRRRFEDEVRRHFVGEVQAVAASLANVKGFAFVYDSGRNEFIKIEGVRTRLVGLADSGNIINVLPPELNLDELRYESLPDNRLVLTNGKGYELDVNEFGPRR